MDLAFSESVLGTKVILLPLPLSPYARSSAKGVQNPGEPIKTMLSDPFTSSLKAASWPPIPLDVLTSFIFSPKKVQPK
jgi:hypothetical protein